MNWWNVPAALAFIFGGVALAELVIVPAIYRLVDWILGPEHRAHKREREEQARRNLIAWEKREAERRAAEAKHEAEFDARIAREYEEQRAALRKELQAKRGNP